MPSRAKLIREQARFLEEEENEESVAIFEVGCFMSLTQAVLHSKIEPLPVAGWDSFETKKDRKGNVIAQEPCKVRIQDAINKPKWDKFVEKKGYTNSQLIKLAETDRLLEEYMPELLESGERYRNLNMTSLAELKKGVRKGIKWHISDNKTWGWIHCKDKQNPDEDYWVNKDYRNSHIRALWEREIGMSGSARITNAAANAVIKDSENKEEVKEIAKEQIQVHYQEREKSIANSDEMAEALRQREQHKNEKRKKAIKSKTNDNGTSEVAI